MWAMRPRPTGSAGRRDGERVSVDRLVSIAPPHSPSAPAEHAPLAVIALPGPALHIAANGAMPAGDGFGRPVRPPATGGP